MAFYENYKTTFDVIGNRFLDTINTSMEKEVFTKY